MAISKEEHEILLTALRIAREDNQVFLEENRRAGEKEATEQCLVHQEIIEEALSIVGGLEVTDG